MTTRRNRGTRTFPGRRARVRSPRATPEQRRLFEEIEMLCAEHEQMMRAGDIAASAKVIIQAWRLIPEPKHEWYGALWAAAAMGNAFFALGYFAESIRALDVARGCVGVDRSKSLFIELRTGQCHEAMGNRVLAVEHLRRALELGGEASFQGEDERYLLLAREHAGDG